MTVVTRYNGGR